MGSCDLNERKPAEDGLTIVGQRQSKATAMALEVFELRFDIVAYSATFIPLHVVRLRQLPVTLDAVWTRSVNGKRRGHHLPSIIKLKSDSSTPLWKKNLDLRCQK